MAGASSPIIVTTIGDAVSLTSMSNWLAVLLGVKVSDVPVKAVSVIVWVASLIKACATTAAIGISSLVGLGDYITNAQAIKNPPKWALFGKYFITLAEYF